MKLSLLGVLAATAVLATACSSGVLPRPAPDMARAFAMKNAQPNDAPESPPAP